MELDWLDVHSAMITYASDQLQRQLPQELVARIHARMVPDDECLDSEPATEQYLEIADAATRSRVITTIEFVSPTNKQPGVGQNMYLKKRVECLEAGVNFVEIDLTRGGDRFAIMPFLTRSPVQPCYIACVRRGHDPGPIELHYLPLAQPLKPILIPLRRSDADVVLELQPLVELAYDRGRYGSLDYSRLLNPPLIFQEAAWVDDLLRAASKR